MALLQISELWSERRAAPASSGGRYRFRHHQLPGLRPYAAAKAETLADHEGRHLLPSVVHYQQQGYSVGYDARANAALDTANTVSSVKRMMGRSLADIRARYPHLPYTFGQAKTACR